MKITKILYLTVISAGLLLSSCSMNREANNTSYLQSGKLQAEQQLSIKSAPGQQMAAIDALRNPKAIQNDVAVMPECAGDVQAPIVKKHSKSFVTNNFIKRAGKTVNQIVMLPKAVERPG